MYPNILLGLGQLMANSFVDQTTIDTTGRFFIVCAAADTNANEIKSMYKNYPDGSRVVYDTIPLALAACVANRGDVVFVVAGHTEAITGAAGIAIATAGVTIVGIGAGTSRPVISFTTSTAAQLTVTAANIIFQNIVFTVGIDAVVAMVAVNATDVKFLNCEFDTNNGTMGAVLGLSIGGTSTSDRFVVTGCRFVGPATNSGTTTTAQIQYEQAVDGQILNSYFTGKLTQAVLNTTGAVLRGLIDNNRFVIATGTKCIAVNSGSTPFITNNRINVPSGTAPIVAAAGFVAGNIYSAAAGVTAGTASTI